MRTSRRRLLLLITQKSSTYLPYPTHLNRFTNLSRTFKKKLANICDVKFPIAIPNHLPFQNRLFDFSIFFQSFLLHFLIHFNSGLCNTTIFVIHRSHSMSVPVYFSLKNFSSIFQSNRLSMLMKNPFKSHFSI